MKKKMQGQKGSQLQQHSLENNEPTQSCTKRKKVQCRQEAKQLQEDAIG